MVIDSLLHLFKGLALFAQGFSYDLAILVCGCLADHGGFDKGDDEARGRVVPRQ